LTIFNKNGNPAASMCAFAGWGFISLDDDKMHQLVFISATPLGGRIELKAPSGRTLWRAP